MNYSKISCYNEGDVLPNSLNIYLDKRDTSIVDTKDGEKEIVAFSGIVIQENNILVSFPKKFRINNYFLQNDIKLLFDTILKHKQDNQLLYFTKQVNMKTNYPFNAFFDIYNYYQKYGIYHEDIVETKQGYNGNVSWSETIKNSSKVISKKGILFLPLRIKKNKRKQVFISECMAYAIDYTLQNFSLFIDVPKVGGNSLQKNFVENKISTIRELYTLKNEVFKDVHKKLLHSLIIFFEQLPSGGNYYLKHYTFSAVWEKMVEHYLNYHFVGIDSGILIFDKKRKLRNDFKKEIFYPNVVNKSQNIQPDHYMYNKNEQFIFDAKYFNEISGINYKQIAYYFLLEGVLDDSPLYENKKKKYRLTHNVLILPGVEKQVTHFQFCPQFNNNENDFSIYEYYLDMKKVMNSYISKD